MQIKLLTISLLIILSSCTTSLNGQVSFAINEVNIISDTIPYNTETFIAVTNETDSLIQFNWTFNIDSTQAHIGLLHVNLKDLNICWNVNFIKSNCGLEYPNTLDPN